MGIVSSIKRLLGIGGHAWAKEDFTRYCLKCGQFEESWVPAKHAIVDTDWRVLEKGNGTCRDHRGS